jgi:hypothetical protein
MGINLLSFDEKQIQENYLTEKKYIDFINHVKNNQSEESEKSITLDYIVSPEEQSHYDYLYFLVERNRENNTTKISWYTNKLNDLYELNSEDWSPEFREIFKEKK